MPVRTGEPTCRTKGPISVAQKVVVTLFDDIDGSEAAETIAFGLDGKSYEIDLNETNAKKLRKALAPYVEAGRKRARSGKAYRQTEVAPDPSAIRAWAQANKMDVPARGRIPKKVYEAFSEAR
nr:Lsr2 family protein [Streptomyces sp. SID2999]